MTLVNRKPNPNTAWIEHPRGWMSYTIIVLIFRLVLAYIPFLSSEFGWTLTNISHNLITLVLFHLTKGTPFDDDSQGKMRNLTFWEQIDGGVQFSATRKFLTAVPVLLFLIGTHFSDYDVTAFTINLISLIIVLVPKYPAMHKVRLFGSA